MKIGRNDLCPCSSGKKYKKCCIEKCEEEKKKLSEVKSLADQALEAELYLERLRITINKATGNKRNI